MHEQGMPQTSRSRKKKAHEVEPWYKRYPRDWFEDTRDLELEERGAYNDIIDLIYLTGGPIRDDTRWIAFRLHVATRVWSRIRRRLLAEGFLYITCGKLMNKRCHEVLTERAEQRAKMGRFSEDSPNEQSNLFENVIDFNGPRRARYPSSDHQSKKKEKREEEVAPATVSDDDDPYKRRRQLDPLIVQTMQRKIGAERTEHILNVYFRSTYAKGAKLIDKAFPRWLEKCYREKISEELTPKELAAEILAMCGSDTALPKTPPRMKGSA